MLQYYILLVIIEVGILEFLRDARNFVEGEKLHGNNLLMWEMLENICIRYTVMTVLELNANNPLNHCSLV